MFPPPHGFGMPYRRVPLGWLRPPAPRLLGPTAPQPHPPFPWVICPQSRDGAHGGTRRMELDSPPQGHELQLHLVMDWF